MMVNKNKDNVVVVFAKKPKLGKVKTRIAKETSDKFAFDFAKACLSDLINKLKNSDYFDLVIAVDNNEDLAWFQQNYSLDGIILKDINSLDGEMSMSAKLHYIFKTFLGEYKYKKAALVPMDVPFINNEDVVAAFIRLDDKKYVFGPEMNGGIYLIGANQEYKDDIFKNVRWSTPNSFTDLVNNATKCKSYCLKIKNDLNLPEDIVCLKDSIKNNCPVLYNFLIESDYYGDISNRYIDYDDLSVSIPLILNIIVKNGEKEKEVLIKKRFRPVSDIKNTEKKELPSKLLSKFNSPFEVIASDAEEELGIVIEKRNGSKVFNYFFDSEEIENFILDDIFYQRKNGRSYLYLVLVTNFIEQSTRGLFRKSRDLEWIKFSELKDYLDENKNNFYFPSFVALERAINNNLI